MQTQRESNDATSATDGPEPNKKGLTPNRRKSLSCKVPEEGLEPSRDYLPLDFESNERLSATSGNLSTCGRNLLPALNFIPKPMLHRVATVLYGIVPHCVTYAAPFSFFSRHSFAGERSIENVFSGDHRRNRYRLRALPPILLLRPVRCLPRLPKRWLAGSQLELLLNSEDDSLTA
jgi:hypothetical protein